MGTFFDRNFDQYAHDYTSSSFSLRDTRLLVEKLKKRSIIRVHEVDKDVVGWRSNRCGRIAFRWPIKLSSRTRRTKWSVEKKWKRPGMRSAWKGERAASQFHTERGNGYDKWTRRCRCLYRQEKIRTFETLPILCAWCCFWQVLLCIRSRYIQNLTCTISIWKSF